MNPTRTESSRLFEVLLEIHRQRHAGVVNPAGLLDAMRAAYATCSEPERLEALHDAAAAGVIPVPEGAPEQLLARMARDLHGMRPDHQPGAVRIPIHLWRIDEGPLPFALDAAGLPVASSVGPGNELSFAAWLHAKALRSGDPAAALGKVGAAVRSGGGEGHADHALRAAEAMLLPGSPGEVTERRLRFLCEPPGVGREEVAAWVLHQMSPAEVDSLWSEDRALPREVVARLARVAMSLPLSLRAAVGRALLPGLERWLEGSDPWSPEAAALLAITDPDRAALHHLELIDEDGRRLRTTAAELELRTGAELTEPEREAILRVFADERHAPREWGARDLLVEARIPRDLDVDEGVVAIARGAQGAELTLDLRALDEVETEEGPTEFPYRDTQLLALLHATGHLVSWTRAAGGCL